MILSLKFLHMGALAIWCAGLLILPTLFAGRPPSTGSCLYNLQRFTRRSYVQVISPAAFATIASGVALIFASHVYAPWMIVKLAVVGGLVMLHLRLGYVIQLVFEPGASFAQWRHITSILTLSCVMLVILALALGKPSIALSQLPPWLRQAGTLQDLVEIFIPIP